MLRSNLKIKKQFLARMVEALAVSLRSAASWIAVRSKPVVSQSAARGKIPEQLLVSVVAYAGC